MIIPIGLTVMDNLSSWLPPQCHRPRGGDSSTSTQLVSVPDPNQPQHGSLSVSRARKEASISDTHAELKVWERDYHSTTGSTGCGCYYTSIPTPSSLSYSVHCILEQVHCSVEEPAWVWRELHTNLLNHGSIMLLCCLDLGFLK